MRRKDKGASLFVKINGELVRRRITWAFSAPQEHAGEDELWVGFYGARPAKASAVVGDLMVLVEKWDLTTHN